LLLQIHLQKLFPLELCLFFLLQPLVGLAQAIHSQLNYSKTRHE